MERSIQQEAVMALLDVAGVAAQCRALRINIPYQRTDMARNVAVKTFQTHAKDEDDVLVMLDADHTHPREIVRALANVCDAEHEVVGALAFRRSEPHDPCFYTINAGQRADVATAFAGGLVQCDIVGTGAIAIRRSVFTKLEAAGHRWPFFRYVYREGEDVQRSEDWNFGLMCKDAGISHWVNQDVVTPHLTTQSIDESTWFGVLKAASNDPESAAKRYAALGMTFTKEG